MQQNDSPEYRDELDLKKYLVPVVAVVSRRKSLVFGTAVAATVITLVIGLLGPRQFAATASVMVPEPPASSTPPGQSQSQGPPGQTQITGGFLVTVPAIVYSQQTYARLLTSSVLIGAVIKKLNLRVTTEQLAMRVTATPVRDTRFVQVTVKDEDPKIAEDVANGLAESLVDYDRQVITAELTQSREFLQTQLRQQQSALQAAEQELKGFNERENLSALEAQFTQAQSQITAMRQAYETNLTDLGVARTRLAAVEQQLAGTSSLRTTMDSTQANDVQHSVAAQLSAKLADLTAQRAAMLQRYTPTNPLVVALDAQIQQTQKALAAASARQPRSEEARANFVREQLETQKVTLAVDVAGLAAKDRLLSQAIPQKERELANLNGRLAADRADRDRLTRTVDAAKGAVTLLSGKATDAIVIEGMKQGFVRTVDHGIARRVGRGTTLRVVLAAVLGLIGGIVLAFGADYLKIPVRVPVAPAVSDGQLSAASAKRRLETTP